MGPVVVAWLYGGYIVVILFMVMRKPGWLPGGKGMLVHALLVPASTVVLLFLAFLLILWGVEADTRKTMDFAGLEVSVEAIRTASTLLGAGIVTGVTAGALIALVQRMHDFEKL